MVWKQVLKRYASDSSSPFRPSKWHVDTSTSALLSRAWTNFLEKTKNFMTVYEEVIGMTQVREAHARVLQAEQKFLEVQELRRAVQTNLGDVQKRLREIQTQLEGMPRGNPKYIELAQSEYNILREEKVLQEQFTTKEKLERDNFHELSRALRFSHEKERAQNEKTKYWSVFGSLIGAFIGVVGSSVNSRMKMRQLEQLIIDAKDGNASKGKDLVNQVNDVGSLFTTHCSSCSCNSNEGNASTGDYITGSKLLQHQEQLNASIQETLERHEQKLTLYAIIAGVVALLVVLSGRQ